MLGGILILLITGFLAFGFIQRLKSRYAFLRTFPLKLMFIYHTLLAITYYLYAQFNASDSEYYYNKVNVFLRGTGWMNYYGTSTAFVEFLVYPLIHFLGFSYEACMALFSFAGFLGFVYFLIFFKENLKFNHTFFGYDFLKLIFFLPNLHFWSSSVGKGSLMIMAFGLLFFGINQPGRRWWAVVLGGLLMYHVRAHIMLMVLVSLIFAFGLSGGGLTFGYRFLIFIVSVIAFVFIYQDVLQSVGIDQAEFLSQGLDLTHRAKELSKATSGVDLASYSLPFQLFTFLFRPLFVDAAGFLGLIVSFENAFYLIMFIRLVSFGGIRFLIQGDYLVKAALFSFFTVALALAQVSGNLGIAMRQKSQVMLLMLFVIIKYMDEQKLEQYRLQVADRQKRQLRKQALTNI